MPLNNHQLKAGLLAFGITSGLSSLARRKKVNSRFAKPRFYESLPVAEHVRSFARGNLSRSPVLSLASRDPAACEQFQLPPSSLKRSQRTPVLCPRFAGQA